MDEMNNNNKNFGEESFSEQGAPQADPYSAPQQAPQDTQAQQSDPYANGVYSKPSQNTQPDPYAANDQYDPYKQPDPYTQTEPYTHSAYQQKYDPYAPQNGGFNGYPQQAVYPTGMAVASLVIGIISIMSVLFMIMFPPFFVLPVIGIVLGAIYKSKHYPVGKGMSTAGIVTSVVSIVLVAAIFVLAFSVVFSMIENGQMSQMMQFIKDYRPDIYEEYYNMYHEQFPEWFEGVSALFANIAAFFAK